MITEGRSEKILDVRIFNLEITLEQFQNLESILEESDVECIIISNNQLVISDNIADVAYIIKLLKDLKIDALSDKKETWKIVTHTSITGEKLSQRVPF